MMGRLTKKTIDEIVKLRKQGYTQKEAAERLRIHIRTVRKYDPLRVFTKHPYIENDPIKSIRAVISVILVWLDVLSNELIGIDNDCPRCGIDSLEYDGDKDLFICRECGYRLIMPENICRNCFAFNRLKFDRNYIERICQECGVRQD